MFVYTFRTKLQAVVTTNICLLQTGNMTMEQQFSSLERTCPHLHEWLMNKPVKTQRLGH